MRTISRNTYALLVAALVGLIGLKATTHLISDKVTKIVSKSPFLLLMVSCFLIGVVPLPAQGYNSPDGSSPNVSGGHPWITNKDIEYLKVVAPDAYLLADQYREQLIRGAWYADHNSGRCFVEVFSPSQDWNCDSINHYEPKFRFTEEEIPLLEQGAEASVSASEYASDLFLVASNCWSSRDLPEGSLPNSCRVPQWRASHDINLIGDFGQFSHDGPLVRISPLTLLGWVLHMVQDVTQVYHTYSMPINGHQEFEDYVDVFIQAGKGDTLPVNTAEALSLCNTLAQAACPTAETSLEVSTPEEFVQDVASETRKSAESFGLLIPIIRPLPPICCLIPENQLNTFTEFSLNRSIIYSAKLLSFYFRQHGATELYNAALIAAVF
jgi:hypothetical protein